MSDVILELSESELPDYVNALLEQNRELREENAGLIREGLLQTAALRAEIDQYEAENAKLKAELASIPTLTDYLDKRHGGKI